MSDSRAGRETEATLLVNPEHSELVLNSIRALSSICEFSTRDEGQRTFRDSYFDTAGNKLSTRRLALRLREGEGPIQLAFKGSSHMISDSSASRREIEGVWEVATLEAVERNLRDLGIPVALRSSWLQGATPTEILASVGLSAFQVRETTRHTIELLGQCTSEPVAEIALDTVSYRIQQRAVEHHELEIELIGESNSHVLEGIVSFLVSRFPQNLRPWRHSKLATGMALTRLAREGVLDSLVQNSGRLRADAYPIIEDLLPSSGS